MANFEKKNQNFTNYSEIKLLKGQNEKSNQKLIIEDSEKTEQSRKRFFMSKKKTKIVSRYRWVNELATNSRVSKYLNN